ncbi:hypothetical protein KO493_11980 [Tamlana agarivorans]|uniref:Uncharacterized protein n=1 Tax=Pseudotamlana agarivorans TaxID=481183 RepID=A0ACC5UB43_9FLAO|nr:hypothetical protein [Tamlana agarivorans]MBU2951415.1 hypothetical protein [Tamlana agarivorans]
MPQSFVQLMSKETTHSNNKSASQASHGEEKGRNKLKPSQSLVPELRFPEFEGEWGKNILKTRIDSIDSGWSPQCEEYPAFNEEWGVLKTTAVV